MSTFNYVVTCVGLREQRARGRNVPHSDAANDQSLARLQIIGDAQGTAVGGIYGSILIASTAAAAAAAAAASATASAAASAAASALRNYVFLFPE